MIRKFKIKTKDFEQSLIMASSVIRSVKIDHASSNIKIMFSKGVGCVVATDTETWLYSIINTESEDTDCNISFCIRPFKVINALRSIDAEYVVLEVDENEIRCVYGEFNYFKIPMLNSDDFPKSPNAAYSHSISLDGERILTAINRTAFAEGNDELRPIINSINFSFSDKGFTAVSTDTHSLAEYVSRGSIDTNTNLSFTLGRTAGNVLRMMLSQSHGDVNINIGENVFCLQRDKDFRVVSLLRQGDFPNYKLIMPKSNNISVVVDKNALIAAIRRAMTMGDASTELVILSFQEGNVNVCARNDEFKKSASEKIYCTYSGEGLKIGFNSRLLLQILKNIHGDKVRLDMKDERSACLVSEYESSEYYEYESLIMPSLIL